MDDGTKRITDNYTISPREGVVGVLGPKASTFTLGWLTLHRKRFWSFIIGTRHVCVLVMFDRKGPARVEKSAEDVAAMRQLVWGDGVVIREPLDDPDDL